MSATGFVNGVYSRSSSRLAIYNFWATAENGSEPAQEPPPPPPADKPPIGNGGNI